MKISASGYVAIIIIAGFLLIGYLFATAPESAPSQLPLILAGIGGIVTLLLKQGQTDTEVAATKEAALASIDASAQNAETLAAVNQKVAIVKTDVATTISRTDEANKQIRELKVTVDGRLERLLEQTAIAARLLGAQEERDRSIDALPLAPQSAGGTTILPGGPTTIAPEGPVTINVSKTADEAPAEESGP